MDNKHVRGLPMRKEACVRLEKWDILRFILMFLVVAGHIADLYVKDSEAMRTLYLTVYTFHMPLFIFVSGLFSKTTVNQRRTDRIFGYFALYIVIKLIFWLYYGIARGSWTFSLFTEANLPWFMLALFVFSLITIPLSRFSPVYVLIFSILIACLAGYDSEIKSFLSLSRIIVYYPFYYLGYISDAKKIEAHCGKKSAKAAAVIIIAVTAAVAVIFGERLYWLRPLFTGLNPFAALGRYESFGFLLRLAHYAAAGLICYAVIVLTPQKTPFGFVTRLGRSTLSIYAFHYILIYILFYHLGIGNFLADIAPENGAWIGMLFIIPIMLICSVFEKPLAMISSPKKKQEL